MRIDLSIFFLLLASALNGQPGLWYDELEYNGQVKTVLEEKYRAVFENDSLRGYEYELFGSDKLFFDSLNRVKTRLDFKVATYADTLEVRNIWNYFYSNGKLDSIIQNKKYSKNHFYYYRIDSTTYVYKPNSRNTLEEIISTNFVDTIRHYRVEGVKHPRTGTLDSDFISKSLFYTETHQKDEIGRREKSLYFSNDTLKKIKIYTYDSLSRHPIREYAFYLPVAKVSNNRNYVVDYKYKLNKWGDVIERKYLDPNKGYEVWNTYNYQYDKYKNWILRETFIEGKLKKVDKRTFEYY